MQDTDMTTATTTTLPRDGDKPLRFKGVLVAGADNSIQDGHHQNRWTVLQLYRTTTGKWVIARIHQTQWQGEVDRYAAVALDSAQAIIEWLREDAGGSIGRVSQELLETAAKRNKEFAEAYVEDV